MLNSEHLGYATKPQSHELLDEPLFSLACCGFGCFIPMLRTRFVPTDCVGSKFLVFSDIPPCHHTRPLVSVTAVGGFGGTKTFSRVGRHPDLLAILQVLISLCRGRWSASHKLELHRSSEQEHTFHNCFELHLLCILLIVQRCFVHHDTFELTNLV